MRKKLREGNGRTGRNERGWIFIEVSLAAAGK